MMQYLVTVEPATKASMADGKAQFKVPAKDPEDANTKATEVAQAHYPRHKVLRVAPWAQPWDKAPI